MSFVDYSQDNPFRLFDGTHIRQIADALRHYHETMGHDPYLLALAEYADEEAAREEAADDPREAVLCAKIAKALGVHPADGATTPDEYWAKAPKP